MKKHRQRIALHTESDFKSNACGALKQTQTINFFGLITWELPTLQQIYNALCKWDNVGMQWASLSKAAFISSLVGETT